jgi:hypothetical protein
LEVGVRISVRLGEIDVQVTLLIEGMGVARWDPELRARGGQHHLFVVCFFVFVLPYTSQCRERLSGEE